MRALILASLLSTAAAAGDQFRILQQPDPWVLVRSDNQITMSGNFTYLDRAKTEADKAGTPILWFKHQGREYVVRDPRLIARLTELTRPDPAMDAEDERLSALEEKLDRREEDLDEQQEDLEDREDAQKDALEKQLRDIRREKKKVERAQRDLEKKQDAREKATDAAVSALILASLKDGSARAP